MEAKTSGFLVTVVAGLALGWPVFAAAEDSAAAGGSCAASFSLSALSPAVGEPVAFSDASAGSPAAWVWEFGDGEMSTEQNPEHAFAQPGAYAVRLVITSSSGEVCESTETLAVTGSSPAGFTWSPPHPVPGAVFRLIDTSEGGATSWHWEFGDGETSELAGPLHYYAAAGTYDVTLVTTDAAGVVGEFFGQIAVADAEPIPSAAFSWDSPSPTPAEPIQFTASAVGGATSWQWDFGDGEMSDDRSPEHAYAAPGEYLVTLQVAKGTASSAHSVPVSVRPFGAPLAADELVVRGVVTAQESYQPQDDGIYTLHGLRVDSDVPDLGGEEIVLRTEGGVLPNGDALMVSGEVRLGVGDPVELIVSALPETAREGALGCQTISAEMMRLLFGNGLLFGVRGASVDLPYNPMNCDVCGDPATDVCIKDDGKWQKAKLTYSDPEVQGGPQYETNWPVRFRVDTKNMAFDWHIVERAMRMWSGLPESSVKWFVQDASLSLPPNANLLKRDGINSISWRDTPNPKAPQGSAAAAALTYMHSFEHPQRGRILVEADIVFNRNIAWANDCTKVGMGQNVALNSALHELGHALGFGDVVKKGPIMHCMNQPVCSLDKERQSVASVYPDSFMVLYNEKLGAKLHTKLCSFKNDIPPLQCGPWQEAPALQGQTHVSNPTAISPASDSVLAFPGVSFNNKPGRLTMRSMVNLNWQGMSSTPDWGADMDWLNAAASPREGLWHFFGYKWEGGAYHLYQVTSDGQAPPSVSDRGTIDRSFLEADSYSDQHWNVVYWLCLKYCSHIYLVSPSGRKGPFDQWKMPGIASWDDQNLRVVVFDGETHLMMYASSDAGKTWIPGPRVPAPMFPWRVISRGWGELDALYEDLNDNLVVQSYYEGNWLKPENLGGASYGIPEITNVLRP